ncbi:transglycosylase SLT domain-containing protein [Streptacidiphilus sp. PB12-B1b]|nr:transglycosylase SLT domain-containing protein [Streptacidiphilus sp. PB12-B1b]
MSASASASASAKAAADASQITAQLNATKDAAAKAAAQQAAARKAAAAQQAAEQKQAAARAASARAAAEHQAAEKQAEHRAAARKAAAEKAATPSGSPRQIAAQLVPADQLASFSEIISHESGWNPEAVNAGSGAYGLGQALPGDKMASMGSDWRTNPVTQIKWALDYMDSRYGSPNAAWSFWQAHNWY